MYTTSDCRLLFASIDCKRPAVTARDLNYIARNQVRLIDTTSDCKRPATTPNIILAFTARNQIETNGYYYC